MKAPIQGIFLVFISIFAADIAAQAQNYYAVEFTDKKHNLYSIKQPEVFLSEKSINRRRRQNIPIQESDLPITDAYLYQLNKVDQVEVIFTSKWLNTAIITGVDTALEKIQSSTGVKQVRYIGKRQDYKIYIDKKVKTKSRVPESLHPFYGASANQISMLNGQSLHEQNYYGQGMTIAVLDAGFWQADQLELMPSLQKLPSSYQHKDFVEMDDQVFETSDHGTKVLSLMAANLPGVMVGTAPGADYVCIKTEDMRGEFYLDEYSWIAGLEYADQIGVDVIVSGLGYTFFNDSSMNYSMSDLQKNKAISTQGANLAFKKGMIVVCSGGNEGDNEWRYVSCPGDGEFVLSVGAVDEAGNLTRFSSQFTEIRNCIKPDITAPGEDVYLASVSGKDYIESGAGTSYSAPITAGLVAALWGAFPELSNHQIITAVKKSAKSRKNRLPDFELAYQLLKKMNMQTYSTLRISN